MERVLPVVEFDSAATQKEFKKIWVDRFENSANSPMSWLVCAEGLKRSFDLLFNDIESIHNERRHEFINTQRVALMLIGAAIENVLKGIYANNNKLTDGNGKFLRKTHTLMHLVDINGLQLSDEEMRLLEKLYNFIVWAGKYPIPVMYSDMMPRYLDESSKDSFSVLTTTMYPHDFANSVSLYNKLKKELDIVGTM